ncbi:MAG: YceI family protein [Cyclobacteriaceae bacterium]
MATLIACENRNDLNSSEVGLSGQFLQNRKELAGKDYLIDDQHSYVGFKIKYFGFSPVRGRFDNFDGTVFYDESNALNLSATIFINVNSINTGNERRDNDLKSEDTWFDATNFPTISFVSSEVILKPDGEFDLVGNLTIKGVIKTDTIHFSKPTELSKDYSGNDQVDFFGRIKINRQDFGVYGGDFWSTLMEKGLTQLSDEVEIELDIHCRKANYQTRFNDEDSTNIRKIVLNKIKNDGISAGLQLIDHNYENGGITSGALSTIGYTLNEWKMYNEALEVFNKKAEYYPENEAIWNQLGITYLLMGNVDLAKQYFTRTLMSDSTDSRALEYLRLITAET